MKRFALSLAALVLVGFAASATAAEVEFGSYWHDGRAELDGYSLRVSRYGQPRSGTGVMIYVTEPFSESKRVKVDDPSKNPADTFDALKLNIVRDFQTGIYDYNTMVSVFTRSADFSPVKLSFSSAEWCGHVYSELRFDPRRITEQYFSYFENESSSTSLDRKKNGVVEDNLFILLRGLREEFLAPGETRSYPFLQSAFHRRLGHQPTEWTSAEIGRLAETKSVEVPAGRFSTTVYVVTTVDGREGRFFIEEEYPHRVVRWEWKLAPGGGMWGTAESGELTGTKRLQYWQLHDNGHERYLEQLGLSATTD